mgnify:CR=1
MTYKIKYSLTKSDRQPHFKYLRALNKATAVEMLEANLRESGYTPTILAVSPVMEKKLNSTVK